MLHFAPEPAISRNVRGLDVRYTAADLNPERFAIPVQTADITQLPWAEDSFDLIIVSHVLEHIPDDRRAMAELRRVLASDGVVISQHPFDSELEHTHEDPSITTPEDRAREFGQYDHVRMYGRDLPDRWRDAGFQVQVFPRDASSTIIECRRATDTVTPQA